MNFVSSEPLIIPRYSFVFVYLCLITLSFFKWFKQEQNGAKWHVKKDPSLLFHNIAAIREGFTSSKMSQGLPSVTAKNKPKKTKRAENKTRISSEQLLHAALICLLLEKHKLQWKRGQRFSVWTREQRKELRNVCTFLHRMERMLTLFLLCPFVFFATLTSGQDRGICYYYCLLFMTWTAQILSLYLRQKTGSKGICLSSNYHVWFWNPWIQGCYFISFVV